MNEWSEIAAWRKRTRMELIAARLADADARRSVFTTTIGDLLRQTFSLVPPRAIAFCWPYRGEIDVRFAIRRFREQGATAALPVVMAKGAPLRFRQWQPGVAMVEGPLGIPFPRDTPFVEPDAALVPLVGFDGQGYRLGYGGGYFDRTLASRAPRPLSVGVGTQAARLPTIYPQPHDIPMDFIVTEAGVDAVVDGALAPMSPVTAAERAAQLAAARGL